MGSSTPKKIRLGIILLTLVSNLLSCSEEETDKDYGMVVFPQNPIAFNVDKYSGTVLECAKPWTFFDMVFYNYSAKDVTIVAFEAESVGGTSTYNAGDIIGTSGVVVPAGQNQLIHVICVSGLPITKQQFDSNNAVVTLKVSILGYDGDLGNCDPQQPTTPANPCPSKRVLTKSLVTTQ